MSHESHTMLSVQSEPLSDINQLPCKLNDTVTKISLHNSHVECHCSNTLNVPQRQQVISTVTILLVAFHPCPCFRNEWADVEYWLSIELCSPRAGSVCFLI